MKQFKEEYFIKDLNTDLYYNGMLTHKDDDNELIFSEDGVEFGSEREALVVMSDIISDLEVGTRLTIEKHFVVEYR